MPDVALVVDDSMVIRHTVSRFLEERGFAVESASNGMEALELLKRVTPALVITDMQMLRHGRQRTDQRDQSKPETASIPILILTGVSSGYDRKEKRAEFTIFKDIDVQEQLEKALDAVAGKAARTQRSGK
jgi:CheY-like chemotaxis protein